MLSDSGVYKDKGGSPMSIGDHNFQVSLVAAKILLVTPVSMLKAFSKDSSIIPIPLTQE